MDKFHITKQGDDWIGKKEGAQRASVKAPTQQAAYDATRDLAARGPGAEVNIHGVNGQIREKNTIAPAKDPRKSKG
jgi:hypothetical protein